MNTVPKEKKVKVVLDTNIIISGLIFQGKQRQVLNLFYKGSITVCISSPILKELSGVLYKKFNWDRKRIHNIIVKIGNKAILVNPREKISAVKEDADNRILECALESHCQFILSGDKKHLLPLKQYKGIRILSTAEFLKII
ncbi:MAG: putative toxin-antitoxin system toxin component, PIN family [bacterium (Candidatus Ratteibacteria) CG_4_10_14_3_um_filter_41_18]|uniref:Putative toxin-antitoxin system toxin component, PIN family n=4 Tax=Candidatus Ratteibacteria TaxID=2979319 RepID=A0A2M7E6Y4_9BACT|nr:MAG: putative toxin-antitoxin system toxin component, PIN family [Candidatus Omnitrophica bacterium CG1_02_41_171]PIV63473.1 MAG: putative toxin-antitoxin system toxin component, PIN family [bacterium (Candidatus Ratteibacteria) CG01_land_8_20_14_3_00_40_19]PIW34167.1 MAG: putative toxin-antitoxin system toxin component, PIN family [bacterium (Candidatus Ratteibacteria) CG15_BIG_FIL_POST_REV_8_21_14_020_41_12]PIW73794.1 MAG: putative toxin-antitoxin system toxin component, PIN family [bacteri